MTRTPLLAGLALCLLVSPTFADDFDAVFLDKTMRVDFFHTGGLGEEILSLDQVLSDGPWPGSRTRLIDDTNLGEYLFAVYDTATNRLLYSRGFASIYGEWVTTPEAASIHRTFHESLRFPWPRQPVRVVLDHRDADNYFAPLWSTVIHPNSRFVNPADRTPTAPVWAVQENGPPHQKVDLVLLADGYTAEEMPQFHTDAKRLVEGLFRWEPFKSRRSDFNVWAVDVPSTESGISRPRADEFRRNPLSSAFNAFDSERYILTYDNRALRDAASAAPYEYLEILVNEAQYGGGGIFANFATASVGAGFAEYLFVHEFGHLFAGLGDEYYTSPVSYATGADRLPEPWQPNVTALHDPDELKWADLVGDATPLPTPWAKEDYDSKSRAFQARRAELRSQGVTEEVMDEFFREVRDWSTDFLGADEYARAIGAFEGAQYEATGLYRPQADCVMFTRDEVGFCAVCHRAIERVIDLYSK